MTKQSDWGFAKASTSAMSFYDEIMVPRLFDPWAQLLLDRVSPEEGQTVVDIACGPGTVTRFVAQRVGPAGKVIGCDLSPVMLELARSKTSLAASATIDYRECRADALNVPDDSADLATCQQGFQFFPDRRLALAEVRRVLRPGGKLGLAVWCAIEECPPFLALKVALREVLGAEVAEAYESGPWGLPDLTPLAALAHDVGFADVDVQRYELPLIFEGGPHQLLLTLHASGVATRLAELSDGDQSALAAAVEKASRDITDNGVVRSHAASHILIASIKDS
jgi:SAM-dependent methyltransferase